MLALGGERKLDLHASGLTAIRWRASRVLKPYLGFLATQPQPFTNTDIPFDALSDVQEGVIALKRTDPGVPQFTVLDVAPLFKDGRGLMRIELVGMDGDKEVASASRFLLVTDLGMIVKKNADGKPRCLRVFVVGRQSHIRRSGAYPRNQRPARGRSRDRRRGQGGPCPPYPA